MQPDGSGATLLTSQPVRTDAQWSPDGTRVAFTGTDGDFNDVFAINDDGTGLTAAHQRRQQSAARSGRRTAHELPALGDAGGERRRKQPPVARQTASPAGGRPTARGSSTARAAPLGVPADVWVVNSDGTGAQQLTSNPASEQAIAFSPDGSKILFLVDSGGQSDVWTMNAERLEPAEPHQLARARAGRLWSPDGAAHPVRERTVHAPDHINGTLYSMTADGTDVRPLTTGTSGVWSPDGTKIAFSRYDPDTEESAAYVMNADGTGVILIRDTAFVDDLVADWEPVPVVNRAPDCSTVTAATTVLGGKANLISATLRGATDPDGDAVALRVTGVTQDEPLTGPGDTDVYRRPGRRDSRRGARAQRGQQQGRRPRVPDLVRGRRRPRGHLLRHREGVRAAQGPGGRLRARRATTRSASPTPLEPKPRGAAGGLGQRRRPRRTRRPAGRRSRAARSGRPTAISNGSRAVGVQQQDPHLAAVAGVDQARRVDERDAVPRGQAGARQHQARVALRDRDRDAGADARPLPRADRRGLGRAQVPAGVVLVRALGRARRVGEPLELDASLRRRAPVQLVAGACARRPPPARAPCTRTPSRGVLALEVAGHARAAPTGPRRAS